LVIGENQPELRHVFQQAALQHKAEMTVAEEHYSIGYSLISVDDFQVFQVKKHGEIHYPNLKCGLLGHYQRKNTITVLTSVEQLVKNGLHITDAHIYSGIRNVILNTGLSGRWQVVRHNPTVVCDTAHNADGLRVVLQQVNETPQKNLHLIIGLVNDKDVHEILKFMPPKAMYYFTRLSVPRTMDENALAAIARNQGCQGRTFTNAGQAYEEALKNAGINDLIVVTGSNFLVGDFLSMTGD
jgi:dihydrofolate synthase/folylpolyglutamate synthase